MKTASVALLLIVLGLCFFEAFGKYSVVGKTDDWCYAYKLCKAIPWSDTGKLVELSFDGDVVKMDTENPGHKESLTSFFKNGRYPPREYFLTTVKNNDNLKKAAEACEINDVATLEILKDELTCAMKISGTEVTVKKGGVCTTKGKPAEIVCKY